MDPIWYVVIAVAAIVVITVAFFVIRMLVLSRTDEYGILKVNRVLASFGRFKGCRLLKNITLRTRDGSVKCDGVLVGYFGIVIVKVCGVDGEYFGSGYDKSWIYIKKSNSKYPRKTIENPDRSLSDATAAIRDILSKASIYRVPVDSYLVTTVDKTKFGVQKLEHPLYSIKEFRKMLSGSRYENDNGVDADKIADAISGCSL